MAKILEVDPPAMASLQPMTPPALDRVVKTCMAKEPDERWQTAGDLCRELKWIAEGGAQIALSSDANGKDIRVMGPRLLILSLGILLLGVAITGVAVWKLNPAALRPVTRTVINLPPGQQLAGLENGLAVALSSPTALILRMSPARAAPSSFFCGRWMALRPSLPSPAP